MEQIAELFESHAASLYRYLVRFCGDTDAAADAVQETFLRFVERPPPRSESVRAWLFMVATNIVRETARTQTRRMRLLAGAGARIPVGDEPRSPHELLEADEQRRLVASALVALSEKERTALLMREEGFTHREIAAATGTTTGSVGTLIARALGRLADEMELDREDYLG